MCNLKNYESKLKKIISSKENIIRDVDYLISNNKIRLCTI